MGDDAHPVACAIVSVCKLIRMKTLDVHHILKTKTIVMDKKDGNASVS